MNQPPVGTVTFLFTDIEGSTMLWQQHPDTMTAALNRHHALLDESIAAHGGYVFQIIGDAFCVAFSTANDGLGAALDAQHALIAENWGDIGAVRVRMALHTGRAEVQAGEYTSGEYVSGLTLSRAARLLSAGHGGQILLSLATAELVRDHLPQDITLRDLGARRLKDLIRPEQIFQVVAPGLPADFAPLKTLDVHPHNLPVQLTSFIGREREMGEIKKLLTGAHLLTLTGVGGTGKTRLALQLAADLIDGYPGGVWLVELARLRDPALVEQTVASVLGVREQPGFLLSDLLVNYVKEKHILLILDNCEHVLEACARLADLLLRSAPRLKILATSRVHMNLAGETTYPVPQLALPDPGQAARPLALAQYEAVRLFIERARAVQPSFSVTNENAPAVAQICTHLDGIPLAIELAAARTHFLSPDQISSRLGDRFNLLTGGSRTALPRQQTLRAALDWSYDLLSEAERVLFNRLAVFAGSFSLEAVEEICANDDAVLPIRVLDLLGALVDHSLVVVQERDGESRYSLLETVRQYALEKLQAAGEQSALQDRHLDYYLQFARNGEPYAAMGRPGWLKMLEAEFDNFRVAMDYAFSADVESAILLGKSLDYFCAFTHRIREAYGWAMHLLALTDSWRPSRMRAMVLEFAGICAEQINEFQQAQALLEASLEMANELGDRIVMLNAIKSFAFLNLNREDWAQGQQYSEQQLSLSQELDDKLGIANALLKIGRLNVHQRNFQTGRINLSQSLELARQEDFPNILAYALVNLGRLDFLEGNNARAIELFLECIEIRRQMGFRSGVAMAMIYLSQVRLAVGDSTQAYRLSGKMLVIFKELMMVDTQVFCLAGYAGAAGIEGQDPLAAQLFGAVEKAAAALGIVMDDGDHAAYDPIIAVVRGRLGEADFNAAWAEGRKLTLEQALELAQE